ncbi:hypothetical protein HGH93_09490 [Chitinophaga polysaccharea]|uniref:DUF5689 domain-containing protein n=1 Tax=Chitinophaga TaxID=79328 RepID=UPI00145558AB|nr:MULTISPECIES: DUF5689 domain-containing protein [Chitinophaga]NLR58331.1 hypothetical protein [Chitinophaga polysaccharea]NLU90857.1 hypothetical protein [Chitinophaga sp. Ak27]
MKYIRFSATLLLAGMAFTGCLKKDIDYAHGTPSPVAAVEVLRNTFKGTTFQLTTDHLMGAGRINGVVISDTSSGNLAAGNLVIQDQGRGILRGITIAMGANTAVNYSVGDSVTINIIGATLSNVNGTLQLSGISPDKITLLKRKAKVTVKSISLSELAANFSNYEGTLVKVNADFKNLPAPTDTYAGDKQLFDGLNASIVLHTQESAAFAKDKMPASATFTGIPVYYNANGNFTDSNTVKQLRLRTAKDVSNASGPLYAGYPEDFESPDAAEKGSYAAKVITLKTGLWLLDQAILGTTKDRDRFNPAGKQCIRMQQNLDRSGYVQMNFDLPNGASKVTLSYGSYYTDASCSWLLEYSTSQGANWLPAGDTIRDASATAKTATFLMNIKGPVRFRINKLGLGTTDNLHIFNGRLSIEDIAIFKALSY